MRIDMKTIIEPLHRLSHVNVIKWSLMWYSLYTQYSKAVTQITFVLYDLCIHCNWNDAWISCRKHILLRQFLYFIHVTYIGRFSTCNTCNFLDFWRRSFFSCFRVNLSDAASFIYTYVLCCTISLINLLMWVETDRESGKQDTANRQKCIY